MSTKLLDCVEFPELPDPSFGLDVPVAAMGADHGDHRSRGGKGWSTAHGQYAVELKSGNVCNRGAPTTSASAARLQIHSDCIADFHGGASAGRNCAKASKCSLKPTFDQLAA
jgi:hypothetical protein